MNGKTLMLKQPRLAPLGRPKAKRLKGVGYDLRPKNRPPGWQPAMEVAAQRKVQAIMEALKAAGYTDLSSRLSTDRTAVEIYRTMLGPALYHEWLDLWHHEWQLVCSAPFGKHDLELPAWEMAYKQLIGGGTDR